MAVAIGGKRLTLPAAGNLSSTGQFHFATVDANGRADVASANSEVIVGIGQNKPGAQHRGYSIQYEGVSKLILGGTVNEGDRLTSDSDGAGVATTTAGHRVGAIALEAGADGAVISALVVPGSFGA